ncbi:MAG: YihY family inner membrane protein [Chlorobi bacterium]|nr:YihY family inner membrane protein [Chlorobiota bacterium]
MLKKLIHFIKKEVWAIQISKQPLKKAIPVRIIRIILLALRGFKEDQVQIRASALTLFTLLSIVPIVAMAFGIAQGFGLEKTLETQLMEYFHGQEEVFNWIIQFAQSFLANTKGGIIAGIGLVLLFWSVMKILGNIEKSFNAIWQVEKGRVWIRKFTDYISIMIIAPVLIILSSSATVFITTQINTITNEVEILGYFSPLIDFSLTFLPYVFMWLLLTIIYMVMPNIKVNFRSALVAGIIAGSVFQITQWAYIHFQVGVSRYGAIYGSFAAFPLFLIWLQISWLIILLGAEISFAEQNVQNYEFENESLNISNSYKKIIALLITNTIIKVFEKGEKALTASEISQKLEIPIRLVKRSINDLVSAGILTDTSTNNKGKAYQPASDISKLHIVDVVNALDEDGESEFDFTKNKILENIQKKVELIREQIISSKGNVLIKDIGLR